MTSRIPNSVLYDVLRYPGVHMAGVGSKQIGGQQTSETAVLAFVEKKLPKNKLSNASMLTTGYELASGGFIRTDVIERPRFKMNSGQSPGAQLHQAKVRPVQAGTSTSVLGVQGTGTITSLQWQDALDGRRVGASNNHVWAHGGADGVMIGAQLTQPGIYDATPSNDLVIGKLKRVLDIKTSVQPTPVVPTEDQMNFADLAIMEPTLDDSQYSYDTLEVGHLTGIRAPMSTDAVNLTRFQISSRTDGLVNTLITGTQMMGWVATPQNTFAFWVDQVAIEQNSVHAGDSGSPLIFTDTKELGGTIFAGASDGSGLANDATLVAQFGKLIFTAGSSPPVPPMSQYHAAQMLATYTVVTSGTGDAEIVGTWPTTVPIGGLFSGTFQLRDSVTKTGLASRAIFGMDTVESWEAQLSTDANGNIPGVSFPVSHGGVHTLKLTFNGDS